jgi:hypothetical protein
MAGRSQLPVQIMENQTRFDLNAAVENWRNELAAQPNLASDDRRGLETHLRDAIAGFQQRGLNDEESFWLARRRVGQPLQLGEEFVKSNPTTVWRERIFWLGSVYFLLGTTDHVRLFISRIFMNPNWLIGSLLVSLNFVPVIIAVLLCAGKMPRLFYRLVELIDGRSRLASVAFLLILISSVLNYWGIKIFYQNVEAMNAKIGVHVLPNIISIENVLMNTIPLFILVLLLIWLMPPKNQKTTKRA